MGQEGAGRGAGKGGNPRRDGGLGAGDGVSGDFLERGGKSSFRGEKVRKKC
jgi:hypothetical protein